MDLKRSSGILLHITSLPSPFGIGDFGPEAYEFIDFLEASGNKYWQILPLNPTYSAYGHSPYSSDSAFAGNTLLISPEILEREGYVDLQNHTLPVLDPVSVNFNKVKEFKDSLFEEAFRTFKKNNKDLKKFRAFCKEHGSWLNDYSVYKVLHEKFNDHWIKWPVQYKNRDSGELQKLEKSEKYNIEKIKFLQYIFFKQWKNLKIYAFQNKVHLIGDIPIYINHDSADCWANPQNFKLDKNKNPTKLSGVPPDYYSETGQLWGTPVYNWKHLKKDSYSWWIDRLKQNLLLFDLVRLDHFRGFSAYWEVGAGEKTAENGKWVKTPGKDFFRTVKKAIPNMPFIAEDLGSLDEDVYSLMDRFNFPGMNVLQFAFGGDKASNPYLPFNHKPNSVVYTGTHDNNTTLGWYESLDSITNRHIEEYFNTEISSENINDIIQRAALNSVAKIAIIPIQDLLDLDSRAVMNIPGSTKGHWDWRMTYDQVSVSRAVELKALNELYGR